MFRILLTLKHQYMKLLLPILENKTSERSIAQGFHNAELVCLYDCGNQSYEWIPTDEFCMNPGELGVEFRKLGVDVIISYKMPPMALGFFTENGFSVFNTETTNIEESIRKFASNRLKSLTGDMCKSISNCSGSCLSCSPGACSSSQGSN